MSQFADSVPGKNADSGDTCMQINLKLNSDQISATVSI